jgi:DNA-binding transcriptional MerR regulator
VPDGGLLTSGEFGARSGLSIKALRLYDRIGLLRPAEVGPGNGYRRYHEGQLYAARLIALLRRLDMPLAQIAVLVEARGPDAAGLLDRYWAEVEDRLARQRELADRLVRALSGDTPGPDGDPAVRTRDVPERTLLTEQRHVTARELDWIGAATTRLEAVAARHGGRAGPRLVLFHSPVGEDTTGVVEVCVPVHAGRIDQTEAAVRIEPAHREAYLPVAAGQFEPPRILSVYDAVRRWVRAHGHRIAGAPREVYDHDPATGTVCDVAVPYH